MNIEKSYTISGHEFLVHVFVFSKTFFFLFLFLKVLYIFEILFEITLISAVFLSILSVYLEKLCFDLVYVGAVLKPRFLLLQVFFFTYCDLLYLFNLYLIPRVRFS